MGANKRKLQNLIDWCARAHSEAFAASQALNRYCEEVYGTTPSDNDIDEIIDAVFGGCGMSDGMPAERFHQVMKELSGR